MAPHLSIDEILHLSRGLRYRLLVSEVKNSQTLWLLNRQGELLVVEDEKGTEGIPLWPREEIAALFATGLWEGCTTMSVSLEKFQRDMVAPLQSAALILVVFPTEEDSGLSISPAQFSKDVEQLGEF